LYKFGAFPNLPENASRLKSYEIRINNSPYPIALSIAILGPLPKERRHKHEYLTQIKNYAISGT
jgi:hypothetical protein